MRLGDYLVRVAIALDQLANALCLGYCDETISSRAWRLYLNGCRWPARTINFLFQDRRHCYEAWLSEKLGRQLPPELRKGGKDG